jgi:hypothetical protein
MGKERQASQTTINQSTTPTPTAEETALNQLQLQQQRDIQPSETRNILSGLDLSQLLLTGQPLPGYLGGLPGGISEDVTQGIVDRSLRDIAPSFQQSGLLDSGVRASIGARTAGDIRLGSATFNLQNLQQLLNLAVGGQAQPFQAPIALSGQLGERLAGLRSTQTQGTSSTTSTNPFLTGGGILQGVGTGIGAFGALRRK